MFHPKDIPYRNHLLLRTLFREPAQEVSLLFCQEGSYFCAGHPISLLIFVQNATKIKGRSIPFRFGGIPV